MRRLLLSAHLILSLASLPSLDAAPPAHVTVERTATGRWELRRDGQAFPLRGVGGFDRLELAAASGVTAIRTWGIEDLEKTVDGKPLIDRAHELGLAVVAGLWVAHPFYQGDYSSPEFLERQRAEVRAAVRKYRDHPALLLWGLGNEMEYWRDLADPKVWRELEVLARIIKEEDPHHPVMTVFAATGRVKLDAVRRYYPSLDILGINLYGPAAILDSLLDDCDWTGPYILSEYGPKGPWEVPHTAWGAPIEQSSADKVVSYVSSHRGALADPKGRCLGTFAFVWGQKQEATATWFGMFLPSGEKTPVVDAMAKEFSGRWPANRSPRLTSFKTPLALDRVPPGREFPAAVTAEDAENDTLSYEWQVIAESTDRKAGGADEAAPPVIVGCIVGPPAASIVVRTPEKPGAYRLFVTVRDGRGGGCSDNIPFYVQP